MLGLGYFRNPHIFFRCLNLCAKSEYIHTACIIFVVVFPLLFLFLN